MTLRIAVFSDSFYPELGGIQDSVAASTRELCSRGHKVTLFVPKAAQRDYRRAGIPVVEIDLGAETRIHRLFSVPFPSATLQSRLALPFWPAWRKCLQSSPDIIHAHTFLGCGLMAAALARRLGVPLVGTNHWAVDAFSLYLPFGKTTFGTAAAGAVARFYNQCDWVTAPSGSTIDDLCQHGLRTPCSVISNPIDTSQFSPVSHNDREHLKRRFNLTASTIIYAGRLAREKHVDVLIHATALLRARLPDVNLVVAGHGAHHSELLALSEALGLGDRVRFTGTVEHSVLADLFRASEVFAIASTSETQSMVLLQAMSCGLPTVGAAERALLDYIPPSVGLLADPGSASDFAAKLEHLLGNARLRGEIGARARDFATRFSVGTVVGAWEALYTDLARGAGRQAPDRPVRSAWNDSLETQPCA